MAQRQWTIEFRADFSDTKMCEAFDQIMRDQTQSIKARLDLARKRNDGPPYVLSCYTEDNFYGRREIELWANNTAAAIEEHGDKVTQCDVSDALVQAALELERERNKA